MKKLLLIYSMLFCLASCNDAQIDEQVTTSETEIRVGEKVMFSSSIRHTSMTRAAGESVDNALLSQYDIIKDDYLLTVKMLEEGEDEPVGTATYIPSPIKTDAYDGTLDATNGQELYWHSNVKKYAFEATAGSATLATDQSDADVFFAQDRLHGYAFSPVTHRENIANDKIGEPNYHTSTDWYKLNKQWYETEGQMKASSDYKKIPLFLQHERAWVTVILKAGKGVRREAILAHIDHDHPEQFNQNVQTSIFCNYHPDGEGGRVGTAITPIVSSEKVHYDADSNGGEVELDNLRYDAYVDPYDFLNNPKDKIAAISLSGMNFSFYSSNDSKSQSTTEEDKEYMQAYNLTAGKHLVIEATLTSERIVFITAWIEDWKEIITNTICDDYGQNGEPTVIKTRSELLSFLGSDDLNRSGNVAIIAAPELNLDQRLDTTYQTNAAGKQDTIVTAADDPWTGYSGKTLRATLNLAGATLSTSGQLFGLMTSTANLINGTVEMRNQSPVNSAICGMNEGNIERVNVAAYSQATASQAGMVVENYGTIIGCHSALPVDGTGDYVGGIAAQSIHKEGSTVPKIDGCVVSARVKAKNNASSATVIGGGIVGHAQGTVTNNTFEYGITLLQNTDYFKNIIGTVKSGSSLTASGNSWPTLAADENAGENHYGASFHNVLDCQEELEELLKRSYNQSGLRYRISNSFTVNSESWNYGIDNDNYTATDGYCNGNLYCDLYGNSKSITLDGTAKVSIPTAFDADNKPTESVEHTTSHMLFSNITGSMQDLTIVLAQPLIATPGKSDAGNLNATDAIAPLAYALRGSSAKLSNIKVKIVDQSGAYVQAANPGGLVSWAIDGATIESCQVDVPVKSWVPKNNNTQASRYAGGIVASACVATIKNCTYYTSENTLEPASEHTMATYYGGIVGGTTQKEVYDDPQVSIINCSSRYSFTTETDTYHGSIVGNAVYTKNNIQYTGTVTEGANKCQGNYWQKRGVGTRLNGTTMDVVIGKCNAVDPSENENF